MNGYGFEDLLMNRYGFEEVLYRVVAVKTYS